MADNKLKAAPQDARLINVNERYELQYWIRTLGVSEEVLKRAIKKVGNSAEAVRHQLTK